MPDQFFLIILIPWLHFCSSQGNSLPADIPCCRRTLHGGAQGNTLQRFGRLAGDGGIARMRTEESQLVFMQKRLDVACRIRQ